MSEYYSSNPITRNKGRSLLEKISDYTVIDIETTGCSIYNSEIIELSAIKVRNNQIVEEYTTLVQPTMSIPPEIQKLTGITNEMVSDKPCISDVLESYIDFLGNDVLLGHNINAFDINMLYDLYEKLFHKELHNDFLDTLRFVRYCNINTDNHKLKTLAAYFGIINENEHRSLFDCRTNHLVYQRLKSCFSDEYHTCEKKNHRYFVSKESEETKAIQELNETLSYMIDENYADYEACCLIKNWLDQNDKFIQKYPFKQVDTALDNFLNNGAVDDLLNCFKEILNPIAEQAGNVIESFDIKDKRICITGEFEFGSRTEVTEFLQNKGAVMATTISGRTDYLVVGELGSNEWKCGNYGNKIKKALECQEKGGKVQIIGEKDFFKSIVGGRQNV